MISVVTLDPDGAAPACIGIRQPRRLHTYISNRTITLERSGKSRGSRCLDRATANSNSIFCSESMASVKSQFLPCRNIESDCIVCRVGLNFIKGIFSNIECAVVATIHRGSYQPKNCGTSPLVRGKRIGIAKLGIIHCNIVKLSAIDNLLRTALGTKCNFGSVSAIRSRVAFLKPTDIVFTCTIVKHLSASRLPIGKDKIMNRSVCRDGG